MSWWCKDLSFTEKQRKATLSIIALDSGLVLKAIHLPREHGQSQEVTLEQLQVFQVQQEHKSIPLNRFGTVKFFMPDICLSLLP